MRPARRGDAVEWAVFDAFDRDGRVRRGRYEPATTPPGETAAPPAASPATTRSNAI